MWSSSIAQSSAYLLLQIHGNRRILFQAGGWPKNGYDMVLGIYCTWQCPSKRQITREFLRWLNNYILWSLEGQCFRIVWLELASRHTMERFVARVRDMAFWIIICTFLNAEKNSVGLIYLIELETYCFTSKLCTKSYFWQSICHCLQMLGKTSSHALYMKL